MKNGVLCEEALKKVQEIGHADIVVGIPSYNNAGTIRHVVDTVRAGLAVHYPVARSVIVNADGGSVDGTPGLVEQARAEEADPAPGLPGTFTMSTQYQGIPGKGSAVRTILEVAYDLGVSACAVVDADLRSIIPEWIELLIGPVMDGGFDYVAPLYRRHKYDGTITNSIVYPLTRALYGKCVRQPIGGDFGFSGRLARFYLSKGDVWESNVARFGIDVWVTTTAIVEGFRVCQSFLGSKVHDPKDPGAHLSTMLYQVVGAAFDLMETYASVWKEVVAAEQVQTFGVVRETSVEPLAVNVRAMIERFRLGAQELADLWQMILGKEIVSSLRRLASLDEKEFSLPDDLWTEIVYRSAISDHRKVINKEHLLKSLTTLYMGRTASFVIDTRDDDIAAVEERIERLCLAFEEKKPFLVSNWEPNGEVSSCTKQDRG